MIPAMHEQDIAIVKGLVPVAWADGTFAAREKEMLDALLDAYHATEQEKRALLDYAADRRTLDDIDLQELSADDRRTLLQHAVLLTFADGEQSPQEVTFLSALAKKLRIPDDEARALPDARTTGSCTAELMLIASGALRAGVFIKPSIWDVAAGTLIVREAGGEVLTWKHGHWQRFERFEPASPERGKGGPALRHWGRPLLMGAPEAVARLTARMAWHPRLPKPLQKLVGLSQP